MDPRVDKVAKVMVHYSVGVRSGDLVMIDMRDPVAEPMGLAVYKYTLQAGGNPFFIVAPPGAAETFYRYASDKQLDFLNPLSQWLIDHIDVRITLIASSNSKALSNVDPDRLARSRKAQSPIMQRFMERHAAGELRWVGAQYPTQSAAQDAEMSLTEYEDFVYGACMAHLDDPIVHWKQKSQEQQVLVDWLKGKDKVEVKGDHVDLTLSIKGRLFINADGKNNFPDGEIFTGPVEDTANGWIRFTYPAIFGGREVEGVELQFEDGKVVQATATKGEDYLNSVLDTDEGARYLGEFAIGTNEGIQQFTRNILFDEKIGGTIHLAVGASYPDTGGQNQSSVHWDMICDMRAGGEIRVDGELFYKDGEFQV